MSPYRKYRASNRRTQRENSRMETNVSKVDLILAEERRKRERDRRLRERPPTTGRKDA